MRKIAAWVLYLFIVAWMVLGSLVVLSVSGWVADPAFYKGMVADERLYASLGDDFYTGLAHAANTDPDSELKGLLNEPVLAAALKAELPPKAIAETTGKLVDEAFALIGSESSAVDLKPVKEALRPRVAAVISAYARGLPEGPAVKGAAESLSSFEARPANLSAERLDALLQAELGTFMDTIPDSWQPEASGARPGVTWRINFDGISAGLRAGALAMLGASLALMLGLAVLAAPTWPRRAGWAGQALLIPATLVLVVGVVGMGLADSDLMAQAGQQIAADIKSDGYTSLEPAFAGVMAEILGSTIRTATTGFLVCGLVTLGVGVLLISLRRLGPRREDDDLDD